MITPRMFQVLSFVFVTVLCQSAMGQFNPGKLFEDMGRQGMQEAQGQLGRVLQDALPYVDGGRHTLPVPPPHTEPPYLPPPTCEKPPCNPQPWPQPGPGPHPGTGPQPVPSQSAGPGGIPIPGQNTSTIRAELSNEPGRVAQANLPVVEVGQLVSINGQGFGNRSGSVVVRLGISDLAAETVSWNPNQIRLRMPSLPLAQPTTALVVVRDVNLQTVEQLSVNLTPSSTVNSAIGQTTQSTIQPERSQIRTVNAAEPAIEIAEARTTVEVGKQMALRGQDFGSDKGTVKMSIGAMSFDTNVTSWTKNRTTVQLPMLDLTEPVEGQIRLYSAGGTMISVLDVQFVPGQRKVDSIVQVNQ